MSRGPFSGSRKRRILREYAPRLPHYCPRLSRFWSLPSTWRKWPIVQRLHGLTTVAERGRVRMEFPNGDVVYCPRWHRESLNRSMKTYVNVAYLGQYFTQRQPRPGDIVLDVGGNIGIFALAASRLVGPEGHMYCCEPVPENAECLKLTIEANGLENCTIVPTALGDSAGTLTLNIMDCCGEHSAVIGHSEQTLEVPLNTVDSLMEQLGLSRLDFIKIDTEGMEAPVLRGARETLRRHHPALAMAAYHRPGDMAELEALVSQLQPQYTVVRDDQRVWGEAGLHAYVV